MSWPVVGMRATRTFEVTADAIERFGELSGDRNPLHFDEDFAKRTIYGGRIAHGAVTSAILSAVVGMDLPGPGWVFLRQDLRYLAPVRIGDVLTGEVEVLTVREDKPIATLALRVTKQDGTRVIEGAAAVYRAFAQ